MRVYILLNEFAVRIFHALLIKPLLIKQVIGEITLSLGDCIDKRLQILSSEAITEGTAARLLCPSALGVLKHILVSCGLNIEGAIHLITWQPLPFVGIKEFPTSSSEFEALSGHMGHITNIFGENEIRVLLLHASGPNSGVFITFIGGAHIL